ncbi:MAG: quinone oxidoreductase, partial [Pseudomonadota bacterium]
MQRAIRFYETGGPEVLQVETVSVGEPGPGEVRVTHRAIGLNFIDTYHRSGLYPVPLPSGLGLEASGVVEAVGPGVTRFAVGDRVAFGSGALGAYATASLRSEAQLLPIPDGVDDETAAAIMLKGMTAAYLLTQTRVLTAQDTILLHAAAGGTGLLMLQWAKDVGARVIGVVGSEEKAE